MAQAFSIGEKCYGYQAKLSSDNQQIADWLLRLTHNQRNWGFGLCYLYLWAEKSHIKLQFIQPGKL